ncbi:DMT family transporter [Streptomyces sp. TP-A0874]|uniref:DMT family transporter n=1 Tax=Streptomyces sp. TP-A0874 TaxID=549819 RepID=UPI00148073D7
MVVIAVLLALGAGLSNATASVLQYREASAQRTAPTGRRLSWWSQLVRRPLWLCGIGALVLAGVFQASALSAAPMSVVQPVMTTELLFTLLVGSLALHRKPDRRTCWAFVVMAVGLAVFLAVASPSKGRSAVPDDRWVLAAVPLLAVVGGLVAVARHLRPSARAAVLGTAAAIGFSCTAALMKDAVSRFPDGIHAVLATWQLYGVAAAGLVGFLLLQEALRAGPLAASQPALTLGDALLSVVLGIVLFDERIRLGYRVLPEVAALLLIAFGSLWLAKSPIVSGANAQDGRVGNARDAAAEPGRTDGSPGQP